MLRRASAASLLVLLLSVPALAAGKDDAINKPLKGVIGNIRQSRDVAALKFLDGEAQGKYLMGDLWAKGTDAQRKEFITLFHTVFAKIAFPKVRENFKNLDTVLYEPATLSPAGDEGKVVSTVLINHPLKKQEVKLDFTVHKVGADWKVVDVKVLSASMLHDIREPQVVELIKEGGWDAVLKALRDKAKELEAVPLK